MDGPEKRPDRRTRVDTRRRDAGPGQQAPGEQEQHRRARQVEDEIRQMVPERVEPPERVVEAEGDPGQRLPVSHVEGGEHPADARRPEAPEHRVLEDVLLIVELDEAVAKRGQEGERGDRQDGGRIAAGPRR